MNSNETQQTNIQICDKHGLEFTLDQPATEIYAIFSKLSGREPKNVYSCSECARIKREEAEKKEEIERHRQENRERSQVFNQLHDGIPPIYYDAEIGDLKEYKTLIDFAKNGSGFLFVYGNCGCGKTHAMCSIKKLFNRENEQCDMFFASKLFLDIRKTFSVKGENESGIIKKCCPEIHNNYQRKDHFAIFDDIGAQKISDYVIETWYNIINDRYMNGYKTIFTSNLNLKEISVLMSDRIASRLASGMIYKMEGNDKRFGKAKIKKNKIYTESLSRNWAIENDRRQKMQ